MILAFCFFIIKATTLINTSTTPSISSVLEVKSNSFNVVNVENIKTYSVKTRLINTSKKYDLSNILLKLNVYNKKGTLIGSKLVNVNFSKKKNLTESKGFFDRILYNIKNFSFKDNIRNKIKEDRTISLNQEKDFNFFFYDNDINARVIDKTPVSISVIAHSARINK